MTIFSETLFGNKFAIDILISSRVIHCYLLDTNRRTDKKFCTSEYIPLLKTCFFDFELNYRFLKFGRLVVKHYINSNLT